MIKKKKKTKKKEVKSARLKQLEKQQKIQDKFKSKEAAEEVYAQIRKKVEAENKLKAKADGYNFDGKFRAIKTKFGERGLALNCECEYDIWNIKETELIAVNSKGDETWECGECKLNWLVKRKNIDRLYNNKEEPKWNIYGNLEAKPLTGFFSKLINRGRFHPD